MVMLSVVDGQLTCVVRSLVGLFALEAPKHLPSSPALPSLAHSPPLDFSPPPLAVLPHPKSLSPSSSSSFSRTSRGALPIRALEALAAPPPGLPPNALDDFRAGLSSTPGAVSTSSLSSSAVPIASSSLSSTSPWEGPSSSSSLSPVASSPGASSS